MDTSGTAKMVLDSLELYLFDDESYEIHESQEWINLGRKCNGSVRIPVTAASYNVRGVVTAWLEAYVVGYNSEKRLFSVEFQRNDKTEVKDCRRLDVCFKAEDPNNFADRYVAAQLARVQAQNLLRKNFYIDCMPLEELHKLGNASLGKITRLATAVFHGKSLRIPDTTRIVHEIQLNYLRTMCRIVFESHQEMGRNADIFRGFLTKEEEVPAEPCSRVIVLYTTKSKRTIAPPVDYADQFIGFSFQTFLTSPEALSALIKVNEECYRILQLELFSVKPGRSVKLEEFQQRQQALERAVLKTITEEWSVKVASIIKTSLGSVGKGWYYLQETRQDTYDFSKLRSLLRRVNFSMKDTLRFLTDHSLHQFHDFIKNATLGDVHIVDAKTAFVAYPDLNRHKLGDIKWQHMCLERQLLAPTSLFTVNLSVSTELYVINQSEVDAAAQVHASWRPKDPEDASEENPHHLIEPKMGHIFSFSTSITMFKTAVLDIFMKMLDNLKNIKQVEQMVMSKLFWSSMPCLSCVSANEDWVIALRESIDALMDKAAVPLRAYLQRYEMYISFINVKEEEYLAEFLVQQPPNLSMIQEAIKKHYNEANTVEDVIPTTNVELGMYSINCLSIRTLLAEKHRRLAKKLLDLQLKNSTGLAKELLEKFEMVNRQLQKTPQNIEELTEMNAYLEGVPSQIAPLLTQSQQLVKYRLVLDYFQYPYDRDDFMTIWKVRLCPNKINEQMKRMTHMLQMQKTQFSTEMNDQQAEFAETLRILHGEVDGFRQYTDIARLDQVYKYVVNIEQKIAKADEDAKLFNSREVLFGQELTDYDEIQKIRRDFEPYSLLWKTANNWLREHKKWMEGAFLDINGEEIETFVEANWASIQKALKQFEKLNVKGCSSIAAMIKDSIAEFRPHVPLILSMRNPGMQDRHWSQINQEIGMTFRPDRSMKLSYVLELGLEKHIDAISRIGETAGKEHQIERTLSSMEEQWSGVNLTIVDYRETETFVVKSVDEIQALLDEQITTTQAMQFSAFKKPFEERINRWERTLSTVSDVLDEWIQVQRSWLYLQPIFDSPDINKQLPTEGKRFATVDKNWRQTLAAAKQKPSAITFCNNDKLLDRFQESNRFLEQVQKGLSDFLETKRSAFSRFYFLSNEELLSILSESKDVKLVQPHLKKCFEGIVSVEFQEDLTITAMISAEGEKVAMTKPVNPVNKNVENWMTEVEDMMRVSIRDVMYQAIQDYTKISRTKWIQKWPGMCVLNGSQFHWTREMEEEMAASGSDGVKRMMERQLAQLADMVQMVRGHLDKLARVSVGALAVIDVHARDVTMRLVNNKVSSKDDFMWSSQLRYYWEDDLFADMVSARRPYGYEYLGNSFRLVITPLTDKCYMTLMAALQMTLGGAPAGPAGTGKTETTKDLAKALAKQCVVFNCSDGLDYIAMGKFFKGLAACGAWACFDEFNRINIEVLSVIGQQVTTLQLAIRAGDKRIMFEGSDIAVNPQFGVFITMNPGYAGRSDLPDSLAALFRPVAMMVPDYAMIGEIMFFAYGYEKAKQCGAKMVTTFKLCSEMLSSQSHYDYGMRAVKTVITAAGNYKRSDPDMDEEVLLLRALQDVNLPKFLAHDIPLFGGIISDLFPGKSRPQLNLGALIRVIKLTIEKQHLQVHPFFLMKVIQLYETLCVRHGLMVVGSTGGGKSANLNVLADALTELKQLGEIGHAYEKVIRYQLNPKSITMNGVKMTKEPPKGIRANLRNSYIKLTNDTLDATSKPDQFRKLLFGLSFFHAVVIERKRFGPLGWNIPYAFNDTDYDISRAQLEMFLDFYDEVPYKVLCVMTSVVNYGGRVTDDKDMRTIDVILEGFFNPQILEDGYKFSSSGSYYSLTADPDDPLASYLSYIDDLPLNPEPEVFGMHDNANITCALAETFHTFDIILALQPRAAVGAGGQSRESLIEQQAQSIMSRLPPLFEVEHISLRYPVMYEESMNTVLVQEVQRYNALLRVLQVSLPNLQRALRGLIVMSPELEAMATCLFNQKVPPQWEKKAYPSLKALGGWVDDLLERLQFLTKWVDNGIPPVFWLSGFFFPQGFLTGILQNHARQFGLAIDSLSFDFLMQNQIADSIKTKPEKGGCYMTGLFLEGARWDRISHSLVDPLPKELFARMPVVHLLPTQDRQAPQSGIYRCPVYKILTRTGTLSTTGHSTNFVFWIEIPSDKRTIFRNSLVSETNLQLQFADQDYWIKAGVACFLSLMY
ncbi:Cyclin-P3-1 [Phytophthora nicotianae]|uniref:Cyclin-P3-1 n=1 Tax=Phytophthora nicotianae TaxID=4792 RepID=A0A0W8DSB4_PHYNI|nr:Cyclin-P3-1 [Phytophthora nicotianae]